MNMSNPVRAVRPSAVYLEQHSDRNRTRSEDEPASGNMMKAFVYDTYDLIRSMNRLWWARGVFLGVAVSAILASIISVWDWRLNPGMVFHDATGTNWLAVGETWFSWFFPALPLMVALIVPTRFWYALHKHGSEPHHAKGRQEVEGSASNQPRPDFLAPVLLPPTSERDLPRLDHNPASRDTARACVYDTYGPPDVLELRDVVSARPPGRPMKKSEWFWDWRARKYDEQAQEDEAHTRAVERFSKYLKADDTVLDYACGTGVVTFKIAADVKEVHAIDISAGMIDLAQERARASQVTNVHFARKTIFDEGLGSGSYDVILAFNILHLLEDARKAVKRISELLKPGGLMVSVTPCLGEAGVVLRTLLPLTSKVGILSYLRTFRIADVNDLMHDGGFEILESEVLECTVPSSSAVARKRFA